MRVWDCLILTLFYYLVLQFPLIVYAWFLLIQTVKLDGLFIDEQYIFSNERRLFHYLSYNCHFLFMRDYFHSNTKKSRFFRLFVDQRNLANDWVNIWYCFSLIFSEVQTPIAGHTGGKTSKPECYGIFCLTYDLKKVSVFFFVNFCSRYCWY